MPRKLVGTSEEAAKKLMLKNYMDSFKGKERITKEELNEKRKGTIFYRHKNRIKYASGVTILGD